MHIADVALGASRLLPASPPFSHRATPVRVGHFGVAKCGGIADLLRRIPRCHTTGTAPRWGVDHCGGWPKDAKCTINLLLTSPPCPHMKTLPEPHTRMPRTDFDQPIGHSTNILKVLRMRGSLVFCSAVKSTVTSKFCPRWWKRTPKRRCWAIVGTKSRATLVLHGSPWVCMYIRCHQMPTQA